MKVSNKKKALPGPIKFMLLCVQHLCAILLVVSLGSLLLNIGIVGEGNPNGVKFYKLNPFVKTETFEESEAFQDIFKDYVEKAALDTVISSQFGTSGEIDENTVIDIVGYFTRKTLYETPNDRPVSYRLDDLLKWGMYGMTYQPYTIESIEDIYAFFPDMKTVYYVDYNAILEEIILSAHENNIDCREFYNADKEFCITLYLPLERYKPVDEPYALKESADDWYEYLALINILKTTISDLSINLDTYQKLHNMLEDGATNFVYYINVTDQAGKKSTFTNIGAELEDVAFNIKNAGPVYFIWDRSGIFHDTNMSNEIYEYISMVFSNYEYALGEKVQIYFAVEGNYEAPDAFKMGVEKYTVTKDVWLYVCIAGGCAIIWLLLFLYLSVMTGRKKVDGETQIVLNWFDYVPTEIAAGIITGTSFLCVYLLGRVIHTIGDTINWYTFTETDVLLFAAAVIAAIFSILFTFFWYSVLRRFKAKTVLKHSLIYRFLAWIFRWIGKGITAIKVQIQYIYHHSSDATKVIWPMLVLVILHFVIAPFAGVLLVTGLDYGGIEVFIGLLFYGILFVIDLYVAMLLLKNKVARTEIIAHIKRIAQGEIDIRLSEENYKGENRSLAESVNNIGNGIKTAVETSMKDERMKADLITNVSHDIKTPLTSIINYVDLLKREHIEAEPVKGYIEVLDAKSQRLKQLTDDLVEASKISSGNIVLQMDNINLAELLKQSVGEFSEKFEQKRFTIVENYGEGEHLVYADPRRMWRVIENLFNNIYKYGLEGTRVYIDISPNTFGDKNQVLLSIKNISSTQLAMRPEELTERFVRGDDSRTTEGSGLGLSIAKSLVEAQGGTLNIILDGDLFKIVILFDEV